MPFGKSRFPKPYDFAPATQEDPKLLRARIDFARKNGEELRGLAKTFPIDAKVISNFGDGGVVTGHGKRSVFVRNPKTGVAKPYNPRILRIIS